MYINQLKPKERVLVDPIQFRRAAPNVDGELTVTKESFEEDGELWSTLSDIVANHWLYRHLPIQPFLKNGNVQSITELRAAS